jgi:hypothetical protein
MLLCVPLLGLAARAHALPPAQAEADKSVDEARQLFGEGLEFVEREDWANAEDRFRRVLALRSSHVVTYNLASALMHLGRLVESSELLRAIVHDPAADATTLEAAKQLLTETEPRIGSLTIRVSGDTTGASLRLDDKPIDLTGPVQTLSVDPGEHRVAVMHGATEMAAKPALVGGDAPLQVEVALELPSPVAPVSVAHAAVVAANTQAPAAASEQATPVSPVDQPTSHSIFSSPWFWVGVGAVVAAGAVSAVALAPATKASPVSGDTSPQLIRGTVRTP